MCVCVCVDSFITESGRHEKSEHLMLMPLWSGFCYVKLNAFLIKKIKEATYIIGGKK